MRNALKIATAFLFAALLPLVAQSTQPTVTLTAGPTSLTFTIIIPIVPVADCGGVTTMTPGQTYGCKMTLNLPAPAGGFPVQPYAAKCTDGTLVKCTGQPVLNPPALVIPAGALTAPFTVTP